MSAIAQTKLVLVGRYDTMTGSQTPAASLPSPVAEASSRVERIVKSLTSKKQRTTPISLLEPYSYVYFRYFSKLIFSRS